MQAERKAARRGKRPRYVLFESEDHDALTRAYAALRNKLDWNVKPPQVIETRGALTIIKCFHRDVDALRALQRAQPLASGITVRAHAAWHWMSPHAFRGHAGVVRALWEERALVVDPAVVAPLVASARDVSVDLMVWEGGVLLTPTGDMPGSFVSVPEDVVAAMTYSNWVALGVPSSRPALGVA